MRLDKITQIDLNTADEDLLVSKLKITPRLAKRIIAFRPYHSVDQIHQVWGLDQATLERILPYLKVETTPAAPAQPRLAVTPQPAPQPEPQPQPESASQPEPQPAAVTQPEPQPASMPQPEAAPQNEPAEALQPAPSAEPETGFGEEKELPFEEVLPFQETRSEKKVRQPRVHKKVFSRLDGLLVAILLVAAFFRFSGINWDQNRHLHPDERFISMVADQIHTVGSLKDYFDTAHSTLNPLNYGSYAYGMLPLFFTRFISEVLNLAHYDQITLIGRALSSIFDLLALWMIYVLGKTLYDKKVGVLAAGLYAAAVFPIQMAHYFTVDSFCTVFVILAVYVALKAIDLKNPNFRLRWRSLLSFALFGLVVGVAGACKINAILVFMVILVAGLAQVISVWKKPEFKTQLLVLVAGLAVSAVCLFLAFRIFQPYAFTGTGFLGSALNKKWMDVIKEVTDQVAGFSEWPPNHHWTSRGFPYAWVNMVVWGLGLPLGIASWAGIVWAAYRMWKGEWRSHLLPLSFVIVYFFWQNSQFWRYMRYFLLLYPFIVLFAAWALMELLKKTQQSRAALKDYRPDWKQPWNGLGPIWRGLAVVLALAVVLLYSYGYAFGFSRIYTRTLSRVAASDWMLKNIQGPLNLKIDTANGVESLPVYMINQWSLEPGDSPSIEMHPTQNGTLRTITSTDIRNVGVSLYYRISKQENGDDIVTDGRLQVADDDPSTALEKTFGEVTLTQGTTYYFKYRLIGSSTYSLSEAYLQGNAYDSPKLDLAWTIDGQAPGNPVEGSLTLTPAEDMKISRLEIENFHQVFNPTQTTLKVSIFQNEDGQILLGTNTQTISFTEPGQRYSPTFTFPDVSIQGGMTYSVKYEIDGGGPLRLFGEPYALETSWDDALPVSMKYYDSLGGIYNPDNLELYGDDDFTKREQMIRILNEVEYIVISSNRAYDSMPRLPNRYPLTTRYYQELFDCNCTGDALENKAYGLETGFKSPLGFDLVATFVSNPSVGPFQLNDQSADESFTVYDHPKVFIFKKSADFSIQHVKDVLNSADLDAVLFQSPMAYTEAPGVMNMPALRLAAQKVGGTWSAMFSRLALVNTSPVFGVLAWYLLLLALGWIVFPIVFTVFAGLPDRGYPLSRMAALLLTAWLAWMLGSLKLLPFTRWTILLAVLVLAGVSVFFALRQKEHLIRYFKANWRHLIVVEAVFAVVFCVMLAIRVHNPDLWQPWMGGEKPMDFAFFNAVLKAVYFPPENPWFAGHYLNYYYYGYVVAAIPTKLIGILPSIAFNLILPGWFAMIGTGVFCIAYNIVLGLSRKNSLYTQTPNTDWPPYSPIQKTAQGWAYFAASFALVMVIFFGNLYEAKIFVNNLPVMVPEEWKNANSDDQTGGEIEGAIRVLTHQAELPGGKAMWYFDASRPILNGQDDTPIAEFPYFTFLYGDLHPHLLTMPFYALALGWMLSLLIYPINRQKWLERILSLVTAAVIFGFFSAAHTWDFYPFLGLAVLTLIWSIWQTKPGPARRTIEIIAGFGLAFAGLAVLFYLPFKYWFKTEYSSITLWTGARTPLGDYFLVYGVSLFVMITLLVKNSWKDIFGVVRNWTKHTHTFRNTTLAGLLIVCLATLFLLTAGYPVLAFGLFLVIGLVYQVFFKKGQSRLQVLTWIIYGIGLMLTLAVEVFVMKGDVGRSNTVFRMYIEAWFYCGLATCLALAILLSGMKRWPLAVSIPWGIVGAVLVLISLGYPYLATPAKIADRWPDVKDPPKTLDGMAYMLGESDRSAPAMYDDDGKKANLTEDYLAIQYVQDHVQGTPVMIEGHTSEYKWGSRFSVYTGLPSVVGWSWHTRQHNSLIDGDWIDKQITQIDDFYNTTDLDAAKAYLTKVGAGYVVVGDLERAHYTADGLAKFQSLVNDGTLKIVFGDNTENTTTIFQVQ
jgi:YYY domain-containing protein